MNKHIWSNNLSNEVAFWDRWCKTKGELWPDDYLFRLNQNNELQEKFKPYIKEDSKILDCGSGMFSVLGRNLYGKKLDITCIDALAREFNIIRQNNSIPDIDNVLNMDIESISKCMYPDIFDFVHAQNCLDHSFDPVLCFNNMLLVCKPGGFIYTHHEINEGKNENYDGLHQWNFYDNDGFCVSNKEGIEINISELFIEHEQETIINRGWITFIIKK